MAHCLDTTLAVVSRPWEKPALFLCSKKDLAVVKKEFAGDWSSYPQVSMRIGDNERFNSDNNEFSELSQKVSKACQGE